MKKLSFLKKAMIGAICSFAIIPASDARVRKEPSSIYNLSPNSEDGAFLINAEKAACHGVCLGHSSAIIVSDKKFFYFYWGPKNAFLAEVPSYSMESLDKFNEFLTKHGAGKNGNRTELPFHDSSADYTSAVRINGNFAKSLVYYKNLLDNTQISCKETDGAFYCANPKYHDNFSGWIKSNCAVYVHRGLKLGTLADGRNYGDVIRQDFIPNFYMDSVKKETKKNVRNKTRSSLRHPSGKNSLKQSASAVQHDRVYQRR